MCKNRPQQVLDLFELEYSRIRDVKPFSDGISIKYSGSNSESEPKHDLVDAVHAEIRS